MLFGLLWTDSLRVLILFRLGEIGLTPLAQIYIKEVVRLHGIHVSIVNDRDPFFTSELWRSLQTALETSLNLGTAYHPQTDGQTEMMNKILENLLRACVLDFEGHWKQNLPLVEFAYNNSYQATTGMATFEALYGRPCKSPSCWWETTDKVLRGPDLICDIMEKVKLIGQRTKVAQDRQKSYEDKRRKQLDFEVVEMVFAKISPLRKVVGVSKSGKLKPKIFGSIKILERIGKLAFCVELPDQLARVHNDFHLSNLRKCLHDTANRIEPDQLGDQLEGF